MASRPMATTRRVRTATRRRTASSRTSTSSRRRCGARRDCSRSLRRRRARTARTPRPRPRLVRRAASRPRAPRHRVLRRRGEATPTRAAVAARLTAARLRLLPARRLLWQPRAARPLALGRCPRPGQAQGRSRSRQRSDSRQQELPLGSHAAWRSLLDVYAPHRACPLSAHFTVPCSALSVHEGSGNTSPRSLAGRQQADAAAAARASVECRRGHRRRRTRRL